MSTPTVRVWDRGESCHRVDQGHPDRFGGVTTTCGILVPWRASRWGVMSEVDCRRCLAEVERRQLIEEVGS